MSIGSRIKQRRDELGITQPMLASMVGVSKGSIGNYESGVSSPNEPILIKLFEALQCDANFLYQDYIDNNSGTATSKQIYVSAHEEQIIMAYRAHPEMQSAVDKLLGINKPAAKPKSVDISAYTQNFAAATGGEGLTKGKLKEVEDFAKQIAELESESE